MRPIVFFVIAGVAALAVSGAAGSVQARWVITDLGPLASRASEELAAIQINERGQVIWNGRTKSGERHVFMWEDGKVRDLGTLPGGTYNVAVGINERGQVAGSAATGDDFHAFLWGNGTMRDLGTLPGGRSSYAEAISDRGEVVGSADTNGWTHAFLWVNGRMRDLGTLGGKGSRASAINDRGEVVGSWDAKDGDRHAFYWLNGRMRDLGAGSAWALNEHGLVIGAERVGRGIYWQDGKRFVLRVAGLTKAWKERTPVAVNGRGQIAGNYERAKGDGEWTSWLRGCLWQTRTSEVRDLGTFGGTTTRVYDLNESSQVVGTSRTANSVLRAFLWENRRMTDLGTLPGGTESGATDINNHNQIVGYSTTKTGQTHAVLWTLRSG